MSRINRCFNKIRKNNRRVKEKKDNKILEIKGIEDTVEKALYEFKEDKEDELKNKLSVLAIKNLFWERPNGVEKETKITIKYMKEIDELKKKNKRNRKNNNRNNRV